MPLSPDQIERFLKSVHPYDSLSGEKVKELVPNIVPSSFAKGDVIYDLNTELDGLYVIYEGDVEVRDENSVLISHLHLRNSFGERGLMRNGRAVTRAVAESDTTLLLLPKDVFWALNKSDEAVRRFFDRSRQQKTETNDLSTVTVDNLMAPNPITCPADTTIQSAAEMMGEHRISSLCITDQDRLTGILTTRDLTHKVVAKARDISGPVADVMVTKPITLSPSSIGSDVLHLMMEKRIGHIPIVEAGKLVGIVTQTDLTRFQTVSSAELVREIAMASSAGEMKEITARIPKLLVQLVGSGLSHQIVTRLITDVADTVTRRLLTLAEDKLGSPPVPYLWLACGSQGRQEQTGVSDQDNCLILSDDVTDTDRDGYFAQLAKFVCDGLDTCGYVYCPGDMMATNPRWCQPVSVWKKYFVGWINKPDPEAQMLASVMFDLRPIGGDDTLFDGLQKATLEMAEKNSIFVAHMVSNSLKHTPPLGLLRGFATIRSGEHKNQLDMKHNGVVPVVDLGRIYALQGKLSEVNTRARLEAAQRAGVLSGSGGSDLLDAYDLIADTRLEHQAAQIRQGQAPDNFLSPSDLSDFERSHLRDAFVVVKSMQSSIGHGRGAFS
ncbi:DUF294 nucleotidyltransferase-like domain-containing protein [Aliiroseovarius sp. KMU-50]|uniref:DUF294 nucleotidyltransferase-like domain-containing protein n=1 Tax=Aliiroseovarius salicola TaxID=3009082 RepID=A0ABT4VX42_9RHOB|nr:DUF294 nucleotidyltransferase-like domain-containing protein [Aliiroseovarius sp. KMU-50]MDA5092836.1 DUF294 nucleotidyltransferase-like domain-containing protein [Aliiroseovarius sp. KMU-50]